MEGFLDLNIPIWMRVTFTRLIAIGPGLVVAIFTQNNQGLSDKIQEWINVSQSILLSFSLLPILHFTSSDKIMGQHKTNRAVTGVIWLLAFAVLAINIYLGTSKSTCRSVLVLSAPASIDRMQAKPADRLSEYQHTISH